VIHKPGVRGATSSSSTSSTLRGWGAVVVVCARGVSPSHAFSALALLRASENSIGGDVVGFGVSSATTPASPPRGTRSSGDGGDRYCCCHLVPGSGVAHHDGDPLLLPPSSSSPELSASWSFFCCSRPHFSRTAIGTCHADRAAPACARVKVLVQIAVVVFGRSSGAREPWIRQYVHEGDAARGVGIEEGMDKAFGCGVGYQRMEVRYAHSHKPRRSRAYLHRILLPVFIVEIHTRLRRLLCHLHFICPEWHVSAMKA